MPSNEFLGGFDLVQCRHDDPAAVEVFHGPWIFEAPSLDLKSEALRALEPPDKEPISLLHFGL